MRSIVQLSDATLEAMLTRRATRVSPIGLLDEVGAAIAAAPQARRPLFSRPDFSSSFPISLRMAWTIAILGLLLVLLAALAFVGSRPRPSVPELLLYRSGIDTLTPGGNDYWSATTDVDGSVWTWSPGHIARVDGTSGTISSWTISDDVAFASAGMAPARAGGVWVIGKSTLRRFDGSGYGTVIDAPGIAEGGEIWGLAETPDGELWAALGSLGVRRWDGDSWTVAGEEVGVLFATFVTVDAAGRIWAGGTYGGTATGGVAVYDGERWTTYPGSADAPASRSSIRFIAVAPDGATWIGTDDGVARLDGATWTDLTPDIVAATGASPAGSGAVSIAFEADGTAWVGYVAALGEPEWAARVARFDGRAWTGYGPADGLPTGSYGAWVTTASAGVYVATSPGLYRLEGRRWERVWLTATEPGLVRQLLAVSRDEAWAASDSGVYHYRDGGWVLDDPAGPGSDGSNATLARAPDGTLWAGGYFGLAVRDARGWSLVGGIENGRSLAFARDGTLWVAESRYPAEQIRLASVATGGREIPAERIAPSPLGWISSLDVGRDGTLWAGSDGFFAPENVGLARFDGVRWERVRPLGTRDVPVTSIQVAPNGDTWVTLMDGPNGPIARFDGTGWTVFGKADGLQQETRGHNVNVAFGPDGTVWAPTVNGLARFDGQRWTMSFDGVEFGRLSVAPDGTVWVTGPSGVQRLPPTDEAP